MATVDKMLIKGIRSFSPDNQHVIEFYKPLTLIVGQNGAGKTTIIECLKMASTGELPPNTRSGQSFIHDPKVAGETEVKANIKLRFRTIQGAPVVVSRSFQLTQKKTTLQFKTLDSTVQTYTKDGRKEASTMRCADMDKQVPDMMGVSKAVLENVIFVHQEDSNWPLAEGQVLKKKFDDIFAATKYTKALEALRKLRIEKTGEVKELRLRLENLKTHKDAAQKLRMQIAEGEQKGQAIEAQVADLDAQIAAQTRTIEAADAKLRQMVDLNERQTALNTKIDMLARQSADMLARLPDGDYEEPTELLEEWVNGFDATLAGMKGDTAACERQANDRRLEAEALKEQYARECKRHGRLAAEAEAHNSNMAERNRFVRGTAAKLGIPLYGVSAGNAEAMPLPEGTLESFRSALVERLGALERELQDLKATNRSKDDEAATALDEANAALSRAAETGRMKSAALKALERCRDELHDKLAACAVNDAMVEDMRGAERGASDALEAKRAEEARANLPAVLAREREALDGLQRRMQELRAERDSASTASEASTRHRMRLNELAAKKEQLKHLLSGPKVRPLLALLNMQSLPPVAQLKATTDAAVGEKREVIAREAMQLSQLQSNAAQKRGALGNLKQQLTRTEQSLHQAREQLRQGMASALNQTLPDEDEFVEALSTAETVVGKQVQQVATAKAMKRVMASYAGDIRNGEDCPLCKRKWKDEEEQQTSLARVQAELDELPAKLQEHEAHMAELKRTTDALKALQPQHIRVADLAGQVPGLRDRVASVERELAEVERQVGDLQDEKAANDAELNSWSNTVQEVVGAAVRLNDDIQCLQAQVDELAQQIAARSLSLGSSGAGPRSVSEIDSELEEVEQQRAERELARDAAAKRQAKLKDELMAATEALHQAQNEHATGRDLLAKKREYSDVIADTERQELEARLAIDDAARQRAPLEKRRDELAAAKAEARKGYAAQEAALEGRVREAAAMVEGLASKSRPVQEYLDAGKHEALARVTGQLEEVKQRIDTAQTAAATAEETLWAKQKTMNEQELLKREISDCLAYRRVLKQKSDCEAQKQEVIAATAQIGVQKDLVRANNDATQLVNQLRRQADMQRGSLSVEKANVARCMQELRAPDYDRIDKRYRRMQIELKTTEFANADLDKYHKALERALLAFHTSKMADINKIVKELWQKTYRGQDIDYIAIKADADGQRSYNYRVVMYSGGAELDMRGRCSAGQKVLACLIIRLALAETFCLNCGILALDEPTTNLDADNAASLAEALRSVMQARREQENFQLIVITHDEHFAKAIGTREHADTMWRITKDENQHTHVASEPVDG